MITGIYKITNLKTNKIYIGSSEDIEKRWANHRTMLKNNKHHSIHLQKSYNKYGIECFKYEIIELCKHSQLIERENFYLRSLLKSDLYIAGKSDYFIKHSYNICPLALIGFSGTQSRESIIKQVRNRGMSPILKIDIDGNVLEKYELLSDINDGKNSVRLSRKKHQCLNGKNYGYLFESEYSKNYKPKQLVVWNKGRKGITKPSNTKKVYIYDLYGRYINNFESIIETSNYFNILQSSISMNLNNWYRKKTGRITQKSLYRFFTKPQDENFLLLFDTDKTKPIKIYSLFDELLGYATKDELCNKLEVTIGFVNEVLNGRRNTCKFYKLKYNEDIV